MYIYVYKFYEARFVKTCIAILQGVEYLWGIIRNYYF